MTLQVVDGPTIMQGESLSEGIDCSAGDIVRITVPQEYTNANMTFQVSSDGNGYNDLYDAHGQEVTLVAKPDTTIVIGERWARVIAFIKLRSGTRKNPVDQRVDCKFGIAIEVADAGGGVAMSAGQAARAHARGPAPDMAHTDKRE